MTPFEFLGTRTVVIASYRCEVEPQDVPASARPADIINVYVSRSTTRTIRYEFTRNSPNRGQSIPGYKWKAYRRSAGPLGWLTAED